MENHLDVQMEDNFNSSCEYLNFVLQFEKQSFQFDCLAGLLRVEIKKMEIEILINSVKSF